MRLGLFDASKDVYPSSRIPCDQLERPQRCAPSCAGRLQRGQDNDRHDRESRLFFAFSIALSMAWSSVQVDDMAGPSSIISMIMRRWPSAREALDNRRMMVM
jgi:hypothetical protein